MPGDPDPLYVAARHVLLDALEAIEPHLSALVLVGAQAVYLHAGEVDLAVAPYTTDGDLVLDPARLGPEPHLEVSMEQAGFRLLEGTVGIWQGEVDIEGVRHTVGVDLLVPESLGGPGRRAARIPPHARRAARKVAGLEGALVDRDLHMMGALDPGDRRQFDLMVAGPAALIVAKVHKIMDRERDADWRSDKDALDVYAFFGWFLRRTLPSDFLGFYPIPCHDRLQKRLICNCRIYSEGSTRLVLGWQFEPPIRLKVAKYWQYHSLRLCRISCTNFADSDISAESISRL